jgi:hypothetical protein
MSIDYVESEDAPPAAASRFDTHTGKYDWQYEDKIRRILEGKYQPVVKVEALALLRDRFGCAYKGFIPEFQEDPDILFEATVQSSGHELAHAPEAVRASLGADFFIRAMERGVPTWVLKFASEDVREDPRMKDAVRRFTPPSLPKRMEKAA